MFWLFALSALVYFLQGIEGLPGLALQLWMKNTLHMKDFEVQRLLSWVVLAWMIKPLWGFLIDNYFTKKKWISFSAIGGMLVCILLGLWNWQSLIMLVVMMAILNWTISIRDVANDGIACVAGKAKEVTHRFQAIQWGSINLAAIIATLGGGYIAQYLNWQIGYLLLTPLLIPLFFVLRKVKEEDTEVEKPTFSNYKLLLNKQFLLVALFLFLYRTAPAFGTPLLYMKQDVFKWTPMQIAYLDAFTLGIELIGAWLYFKYARKIPIKKTLIFSIFLGVPTTLAYLYFTPFTAWLYGFLFGSIGMIIFLVSMDFMARKSIDGLESTSFALLCSVSNCAGWCSAQLGALTLQYWGLPTTIIISAFTGLIALPLVKYIKW
jgi:MFS family permease